jgi:hypothetical protein
MHQTFGEKVMSESVASRSNRVKVKATVPVLEMLENLLHSNSFIPRKLGSNLASDFDHFRSEDSCNDISVVMLNSKHIFDSNLVAIADHFSKNFVDSLGSSSRRGIRSNIVNRMFWHNSVVRCTEESLFRVEASWKIADRHESVPVISRSRAIQNSVSNVRSFVSTVRN